MNSDTQRILIGLAIAATVGLFLLGVIVSAAIYGQRVAERAGNEAATIQNMKTIATVEMQYFNNHNRFGSFDQLIKENMLSSKFAGNPPPADGYAFDLRIDGRSYKLNADPIDNTYGRNHFYVDSTSSVVHVNSNQAAGPSDSPN